MCGLVLVGSLAEMASQEQSLFEDLLFMDTIRGVHATGVIAGYNFPAPSNESYSLVAKTDKSAPLFLMSNEYKSISSQEYTTAYNTKGNKRPHFMVGHNRHATRGAKTAKNAHPFVHGNITLAHNGTLSNQHHLPESHKFEVDSENICYSIDAIGAAETIQKLEGAYTLIWHDQKEKTVNIIRNEERPFHLAKSDRGTWFGASEEAMLMWILTRDDKYSLSRTSPKIVDHFECKVGTQYIFDVSDGKFSLKDQVAHTLPKFKQRKHYSYTPVYDINPIVSEYQVEVNSLLEGAGVGVKVGDRIQFESLSFSRYPSSHTYGKLSGNLSDSSECILVEAHSVKESVYKQGVKYIGDVVSAYKKSGSTYILVNNVEEDTEGDHLVGLSGCVVMEDCVVFTQKEWEESHKSTCPCCNTRIPFDEAADATATAGMYICVTCSTDVKEELALEGHAAESAEDDAPFQREPFYCINCGMRKYAADESAMPTVCKECCEYFSNTNRKVSMWFGNNDSAPF